MLSEPLKSSENRLDEWAIRVIERVRYLGTLNGKELCLCLIEQGYSYIVWREYAFLVGPWGAARITNDLIRTYELNAEK